MGWRFNPFTGKLAYYSGDGDHFHDGDTLRLDGINSDGGAFPFTTSGPITLSQNLIIPDAGNIGSVSTPGAVAIDVSGNVTVSGNITFPGAQTVDGRDVSVDGALLDTLFNIAAAMGTL